MLSVQNLKKSYKIGKENYDVLKGISFEVEKGEFVSIMGASGSGKTTLLNCISCYIPTDTGSIKLNGDELSNYSEEELAVLRNKKLGFIFQDFMLLDGITVRDNIILPKIISGDVSDKIEKKVDDLCEIFNISHIKDKYPAVISGGEKQRTAVARSLIGDPLLILADEPTGNLDSKSTRAVIETFKKAKNSLSATILMVTHDSFTASFCDKVIVLRDGLVWKELKRGEKTHLSFQDELLDVIRSMGEVDA